MHLPTFALLFLTLCSHAHADYYTHFIRYKAEPDFSRIVISWEELRGERGVDHMHANPELYATQGDYLTRGQYGGSKEITQVEKMDGHEVKTVITIRYPRGHGRGGACSWNDIKVFFDGELQLDSPIGYNHQHDLTVSKILIHVQNQTIQAISRQAVVGEHYHFIDHKESEPLRLPKDKDTSNKQTGNEQQLPPSSQVSSLSPQVSHPQVSHLTTTLLPHLPGEHPVHSPFADSGQTFSLPSTYYSHSVPLSYLPTSNNQPSTLTFPKNSCSFYYPYSRKCSKRVILFLNPWNLCI